jgi:hypothetical protein
VSRPDPMADIQGYWRMVIQWASIAVAGVACA